MERPAGSSSFYDRVAERFGEYRTGARPRAVFQTGDPEDVFRQRLIQMCGPTKAALDVGSGDGRFTLSIAGHFGRIVGIETSRRMRDIAERRRRDQDVTNVEFEDHDASATGFPDASFDVVYSRRGPTEYREFQRLLKPDGYFLHIGIGERDALDLKQVFGRGQGFRWLDQSWMRTGRTRQEEAGLQVRYAEEFLYDEFHRSYEALETFLQGVPIFEDFNPDGDRPALEAYVTRARTPEGIPLPRHRWVTVSVNSSGGSG